MGSVSDDIYRFLPLQLSEQDFASVHGIDEHISIENLDRMITFYQRIMVVGGARVFPRDGDADVT
jgi:carboxypeptidase PM20D1